MIERNNEITVGISLEKVSTLTSQKAKAGKEEAYDTSFEKLR